MLRYAHVEATVKKFYCVKYDGYPDSIPYFFYRKVVGHSAVRNDSANPYTELQFVDRDGRSIYAVKGTWIIVEEDGATQVLTDEEYRRGYVQLDNLNYQK